MRGEIDEDAGTVPVSRDDPTVVTVVTEAVLADDVEMISGGLDE